MDSGRDAMQPGGRGQCYGFQKPKEQAWETWTCDLAWMCESAGACTARLCAPAVVRCGTWGPGGSPAILGGAPIQCSLLAAWPNPANLSYPAATQAWMGWQGPQSSCSSYHLALGSFRSSSRFFRTATISSKTAIAHCRVQCPVISPLHSRRCCHFW